MVAPPDLILLGYGVFDSLQLTVETQQVLVRYGRAFTVGLPPALARHLRSLRVKVTDLADRLPAGRPFAEAYLDIASHLLQQTAGERPVIVLMPGNPLSTNAVSRLLAMECRRLGLTFVALPAVSQFDVILSAIGLDVSAFGLQVFDATRVVSRSQCPNPGVPLLVLHAGAFALEEVPGESSRPEIGPLAGYLARFYPASHTVALVDLDTARGAVTVRSLPLDDLAGCDDLHHGTSLFLDRVIAAPSELAGGPG